MERRRKLRPLTIVIVGYHFKPFSICLGHTKNGFRSSHLPQHVPQSENLFFGDQHSALDVRKRSAAVMDYRLTLYSEPVAETSHALGGPVPHCLRANALNDLRSLLHVEETISVLVGIWLGHFHPETKAHSTTEIKQDLTDCDEHFRNQADGFYA